MSRLAPRRRSRKSQGLMARTVWDLPVERPILAAAINLVLIALGLGAILSLPIRE